MVDVEGRTTGVIDRAMSRRRAVRRLATLAFALSMLRPATDRAEAAKGKDKSKKGHKDKEGKNKQKSGGSGAEVVRVAKKYKDAKYVWGGESPRGFDCSGFTMFVYQEATGMDIGRTVPEQWKQGRSVSRGDLSPGDLVFFKNTFERGLSHDGISLGGSMFIHAENEQTDVVISDLSSGYYDDHYAGARRLV